MTTRLLAVLLLAGCGGADFAGTYEGPLALAGPCATVPPDVYASSVKITQYSSTLRMADFGLVGCDSYDLAASGATATVKTVTCPGKAGRFPTTEVSGTVTLSGDELTAALVLQQLGPSPGSRDYQCGGLTLTGKMKKL